MKVVESGSSYVLVDRDIGGGKLESLHDLPHPFTCIVTNQAVLAREIWLKCEQGKALDFSWRYTSDTDGYRYLIFMVPHTKYVQHLLAPKENEFGPIVA